MKNIFKILIFLFFQSLTMNLSAATSNDCAVNNDKVKEYSYEICQQDESFRVLYEMFPRLFDEGIFLFGDFGEIEELKTNPEIALDNQYKKFSNLFYEIFNSMSTLITYLIMFFVFYNTFFTILKTTEEGGFIDYNRESLLKTFGYAGVTIFLLLPVGNLITAQLVLLAIAILGISLANYIYGYYLASLQTNIEYIASEEDKENRFLIDDYSGSGAATSAKSYASQLTKIALCRETTSQYIMTQEAFSTNSSNLNERLYCSAGTETFNKVDKTSPDPYPSFFNIKYDDIKPMTGSTLTQNKNIKFGVTENRMCPTYLIRSYSCGEITTQVPKISDNYLINIYGFEKFINKIISVSNSLSLVGNNQTIIENGWESLKTDILNEINIQAKKDKNNLSEGELTTIKMAEEIYYKRDLMQLKKLSYIYHQLILNSLTSGLSFQTYENDGMWNYMLSLFRDNFEKDYDNFNAFERDWSRVKSLAKKIQKNHCQLNSTNLNNSYMFLDRLNKNSFLGGGTSTRCVDFDSMQVYGVDSEGKPFDKLTAIKESENLIKEIEEDFKEISQEIFNRRVAVEMSFINSLKEMQDENLLNDIRKRGWLTMPSYIMEFSKDIKVNNTYIKALIGSNGFKPLGMERNMVSYEIMGDPAIFNNSFVSYTGLSNVFKMFIDQKKENSIYEDNATFTQALIEGDKEKFLRGDQNLTEYIFTTLNPIEPLKETLGLDMVENLTDAESNLALIEECQEDIDKCPIPKKDPIVELNRYGHYLINNSLQYFAILISLKGLASFGKGVKNYNENLKNKKDLQENMTAGITDQKNAPGGKSEFLSASLSIIGDALNIISDILSGIGFLVVMLFFVGVFLAYILPLIPLIYFVVGFLGWLLIVIQTLMIVPVWAVYFIKYKDYKDIINSAAKTYGIQIILKPSFMVIGLMFAWELIKVGLFFINVTIFPLLNAMSSDTTLVSFTQNVVFLMIFVFIIGIMISFILNVMQNLSDQLLTMLDIRPAGDSNQGFSSIMQYYMLNAGMEGRDKIAKGITGTTEMAGLKFSKLGKELSSSKEDYNLMNYGEEKNFLKILKDFANPNDPNLMTDDNLIGTMQNDVEDYEIKQEVKEKLAFENKELEKMKQDYEKSKNHEKDIVDRVKGEMTYKDENGNKISTNDMTRTQEELKNDLKAALSKEIEKTITFADQELDIKVNINGSEYKTKSFETIFDNGKEVGTLFSDGQGNEILIQGESNIQEEDLKQILEEQIEEAKNNAK